MKNTFKWLSIALLTLSGIGLMIWGLIPHAVKELPVPADQYDPNPAIIAHPGEVEVHNSDHGPDPRGWDSPKYATPVERMSVDQMEPNSVFVPSRGIYALLRGDSEFTSSQYRGFDTLVIPHNPHRGTWYTPGAQLAGGDEGITLISSHIAAGNIWGAFTGLSHTQLGEQIYTKDIEGVTAAWTVIRTWHTNHTNFPADYFTATGPRKLVLTTCGGKSGPGGDYIENIFIEAVQTPVANDPLLNATPES